MKRRYSSHYAWRRAQSIDELAWMARQRLPAFAWEYVHGGSEDETTLAQLDASCLRRSPYASSRVDAPQRPSDALLGGETPGDVP